MGWRFRRSIGGKYFRLNLGKHGVNGVTLGGRGMPHVTTGRTGTRVGASIPGTGISYTHKIDARHPDTAMTERIDTAPTLTLPAQPQPTTQPPSDGGTPHHTGMHGEGKPLPWSKLIITSLFLSALAVVYILFKVPQFAILLSLVAFLLGISGLVVIQLRKSRRSTILAVISIIVSVAMMVVSLESAPSSTGASPSTTHSISASQRAAQVRKKEAARKRQLAEEQREKEAEEKLAAAKDTLTSKLDAARNLLNASNGNVADETTRDALTVAIAAATNVDSMNPDDWTSAVQPLQSAMDTVTASETKKQQDDAEAAQARADAEAKAQADAKAKAKADAEKQQAQENTQPQQTQQQNTSGSLVAICVDGTRSTSSPGASDYRGMCSHHHGIAQKLGRQ